MRQATQEERKAMQAPRKPVSFLCGHCSKLMCDDCKSIAEEYQELLARRTNALAATDDELEKTKRELETWKRRAAMFEDVAKAGIPAVIIAWIDKEIGQLVKQGDGVGELVEAAEKVFAFRNVMFSNGPHTLPLALAMIDLQEAAEKIKQGSSPAPAAGQNPEQSK